ncbi:MAG: pyridoxamine 5-phosphate oxidase [Rhizobiaceae bacterium]|nr:pyridoxamine 5-phosphate oxidase [Rhizobiaceae bacterium]
MSRAFAEITFTPSVLAAQEQQGSAEGYANFLQPDAERGDRIGPQEAQFISLRDGFYQATVSETGWPYVQFRGGPKGFLKVLDDKTIAYADFRGNRQYLSVGNLNDNDRISLIVMDYPNRRRLKIWGRVKLVGAKEDALLMSKLRDPDYRGLPERAVVITVEALDWNCPQHIPQRLTLEELEPQLAPVREEIAKLREENAELKAKLDQTD